MNSIEEKKSLRLPMHIDEQINRSYDINNCSFIDEKENYASFSVSLTIILMAFIFFFFTFLTLSKSRNWKEKKCASVGVDNENIEELMSFERPLGFHPIGHRKQQNERMTMQR